MTSFSHSRNGSSIKRYAFTHHKAGYLLARKIFKKICGEFQWKFEVVLGKCSEVPLAADVVLFAHSMVDIDRLPPFKGIHVIRDPREIVTSGYLYHKRCREKWCINQDFADPGTPIRFPYVPYSQEFRSEVWKKEYLRMLGGKSYQQNLLDRNQADGMLFEMQNYGRWTIDDMLAWDYTKSNILELTLEGITADFDGTFRRLFEFMEFDNRQIERAMAIARTEDINRMSDDQVVSKVHITSREQGKWRRYFDDDLRKVFKAEFGDAVVRLGYEQDNNW